MSVSDDATRPTGGGFVAEGVAVWRAAFPSRGVDDQKAKKLGANLSFALAMTEFRCSQTKKRQAAEIAHLEKVRRKARELVALINESGDGSCLLLMEMDDFDRDEGTSEKLETIRDSVVALEAVASAALASAKEDICFPPAKGETSPMKQYINVLAEIYEKFSGRRARVWSNREGDKTGPFVRFVQEALSQRAAVPPKGSTIADALRVRKKARTAP